MENTDNKAVVSNKQKFRDDFASRYPDIDMNDEEAYFGALNEQNEQNAQSAARLKEYEESERKLGEAFDADERNAGLFLELTKKDGKPLEFLIDNYGDEFAALLNDPDNDEFRKRLAEKHAADMKKSAEAKALNAQAEKNIGASLQAFDKVSDEMSLTDEQRADLFEKMTTLTKDLIVDKVSEDVWRMMAKGLVYDADVEQADMEGEVRGKNSRISEKLRKEQSSALNAGGGGGNASPAGGGRRRVSRDFGQDWFEKGQQFNEK